jgi:hypothetical protein
VLAVYREDEGFSFTRTASLILAIWPDGSVVWSTDRLGGGPPYRTGTVDPKRVTALLSAFEKDGAFADEKLKRPRFNSHMSFMTILVKSGKRQLKMQSCHELGEASGNLVDTGLGPSWLEGRSKLADLIPSDSKPIAGKLVRKRDSRDSWSWQEEPAKPQDGAAAPPGLDELLATYRKFGLPLPPAEAKLVHFEHGRGSGWSSEVGFYISTSTSLGFLLKPGAGKQSSVVLVGTEEHGAWQGIKAVEPDPKLALVVELVPWGVSVFGMNTGLATAMQCKARGWDDLAQALMDGSLRKDAGRTWNYHGMFYQPADMPPRMALAYLAWVYWANEMAKPGPDRGAVLKRMKQVFDAEPALNTEERRHFLRWQEAAMAPGTAPAGSVEALVEDLANLSPGTWFDYHADPRYVKVVNLGFDAVPALLDRLDDQRLTRIVWVPVMGKSPPHFEPVGSIAGEILRYLADETLPWHLGLELPGVPSGNDAARKWWAKASKEGEEAYLMRNVLPARPDARWPNTRILQVLAAKYPRTLAKVYQTILTDRPLIASSYVAAAIRTSALPREEKRDLLQRGAFHNQVGIRNAALAALKELDKEP